ncbi:WhiB family transcriptional regulator [Georgenia wangjunii]|uniref:WhiB family transcriptional regulator n=1 Tax=Georgenia wangjunii TaxID=3117730 RepID=UPI002F25F180
MQLTTLLDSMTQSSSAPWPSFVPPAAEATATVDVGVPCRGSEDADLWFAERTADVERAKDLCRACPLRAECLAGALERAEPWGVWGGEVFVDGRVVARKRGRGRPPKNRAVA